MSTQRLTLALDVQVRRFGQALARARRGDAAGVHQARVASRRIREMLPLVGAAGESRGRRTRRDVRRVAASLGAVRELDVTREGLAHAAARHTWLPAVVAIVREHLEADRGDRHAELLEALRRVGTPALLRDLRRAATGAARGGVVACHQALATRRRKRAMDLAGSLRTLGTLYDPDRLHTVRLAAKKLRYSLEADRAVRRAAVARDIGLLTRIQEELGRLHDLQMLQDHLWSAGRDAGADRATQRYLRRMITDLEGECRRVHAHVVADAPAWRRLADRVERR